jgi:hypothetical protein
VLAIAAGAGLAIEGTQVVLQVGIFDIDDVILNGFGVMAGYGVFTVLEKKLRSMKAGQIWIAAPLVIAVVGTACYGLVIYEKSQFPPGSEKAAVTIPFGDDPCGGTGGLGQIVGIGSHSITIKRGDGVKEMFKLTDQTKIRNSAGAVLVSGLKIGDRATIVTFESDREGNKIVAAVFICNASNPGS